MNQTNRETKTQHGLRTNIPTRRTSFVGRERELAEISCLSDSSRLLHVEWWRVYDHFSRPHESLRQARIADHPLPTKIVR